MSLRVRSATIARMSLTERANGIEVVFETHSMTEDNERGIASGWRDTGLSSRGRQLARDLGERRRTEGIAAVFTSDLGRAVETAAIAFAGSGIPVRSDARLRECDYGTLSGRPTKDLTPRSRWIESPFPGGESYRDVVARVGDFLRDLGGFQGQRVLVVGHSATLWALAHLLEGEPLESLVDAPFIWQPGWAFRVPISRGGAP